MLETLECPTPFIMGIHSSYAFKRDFPFVLDLVVVNLDLGTLTQQQANAEMLDENEEAVNATIFTITINSIAHTSYTTPGIQQKVSEQVGSFWCSFIF